MEVLVPECQKLSLEGIRNILMEISEKVNFVYKKQRFIEETVKEELNCRPTLMQVLQALHIAPDDRVSIDLNTLKNILMSFESNVRINLNKIEETARKYEENIKKLIDTANKSLSLSHVKYQKSQLNSKKNLRLVLDHLFQQFQKNKKRRILTNWKKISQNQKESARKLLTLEKTHEVHLKQKHFTTWSRKTSSTLLKSLKLSSINHQKTLKSLSDQVEVLNKE
jgi:hypothetical protein